MNVKRNMPYAKNGSLLEALLKKQKNKDEAKRILKMNNGGIGDPRKDPNNRRALAELPNQVMEDLLPFLEEQEAFEVAEARRAMSKRRDENYGNAIDFMRDQRSWHEGRAGDEDAILESAQLRQDFGIDDFQKAYLSPDARKVALSFVDTLNPRNKDRDALRLAAVESGDLGKAVAGDSPEMQLLRLAYYATQNPDSKVAQRFRDRAERMGLNF